MRMMAAAWIIMRIGKDPKISHAGEDELLTAINNPGDALALTQGCQSRVMSGIWKGAICIVSGNSL